MTIASLNNTTDQYFLPKTIEEAIALAKVNLPNVKYIAGGTDVMVNRFQGNLTARTLIDLSKIDSLSEVISSDEYLQIGAMVTLDRLGKIDTLRLRFPALIDAADAVGSPLIRKSATIGGNILCENRCSYFNQSEFWRDAVGFCLKCEGDICLATKSVKSCYSRFISDTAPVLIGFDASLLIHNDNGERICKLHDIYTGDGVTPVNLTPVDVIKAIRLPMDRQVNCVFRKLRLRQSLDFSSLSTAVALDEEENITIAMSGIDPMPIVVKGNLKNDDFVDLMNAAYKKARTIDNDFFSRKYRKMMISEFLHSSIHSLSR